MVFQATQLGNHEQSKKTTRKNICDSCCTESTNMFSGRLGGCLLGMSVFRYLLDCQVERLIRQCLRIEPTKDIYLNE